MVVTYCICTLCIDNSNLNFIKTINMKSWHSFIYCHNNYYRLLKYKLICYILIVVSFLCKGIWSRWLNMQLHWRITMIMLVASREEKYNRVITNAWANCTKRSASYKITTFFLQQISHFYSATDTNVFLHDLTNRRYSFVEVDDPVVSTFYRRS